MVFPLILCLYLGLAGIAINFYTMKEGTVKFFNSEKGFGFIIPTDGTEDIFVHRTGLKEGVRLTEGDKVKYDEAQGKKGMNAVNVEKI